MMSSLLTGWVKQRYALPGLTRGMPPLPVLDHRRLLLWNWARRFRKFPDLPVDTDVVPGSTWGVIHPPNLVRCAVRGMLAVLAIWKAPLA